MKSNIFKRYELKYLLTKEQYEKLKFVMKDHMEPDKFFKTTNCNIYFDTPDSLLIRRSLEKPLYKEKLRLRSYGVPTKEQEVFIELKKKYDGIVYKRRMRTVEEEAMDYLCKGDGISQPSQISKEIDYFMTYYGNITPSIYLSYDRESYAGKIDSDFRMTFDENILFRQEHLTLSAGIFGTPILEAGKVLMEVKTALGLPMWLINFLSENKIYKTSFSKYGRAYQDSILPKTLGGNKHVA